jgi:hypothetical protein
MLSVREDKKRNFEFLPTKIFIEMKMEFRIPGPIFSIVINAHALAVQPTLVELRKRAYIVCGAEISKKVTQG